MICRRECHCNVVVLIRNRTIRAYVVVVVVILNAQSWLSGVLCYRGYKPARAQQAPLWERLKAGTHYRIIGAIFVPISPLRSKPAKARLSDVCKGHRV